MIDLWPEEDSPTSKLGRVFDEAMRSPKTYQQIRNGLLDRARTLRARREPVPEVLERLERNCALQTLAGQVLNGTVSKCAEAWLRERGPFEHTLPEEFVEHWRVCATCQAALRGERNGQESEVGGRK